jgi:hypothetical protein
MNIQEARILILKNRGTDGRLTRFFVSDSGHTLQEKIFLLCIMTYYLMADFDIELECNKIFESHGDSVREERKIEHQDEIEDEYNLDRALADDLQEKMKGYLQGSDMALTEESVESVVDRLIDYFFKPQV